MAPLLNIENPRHAQNCNAKLRSINQRVKPNVPLKEGHFSIQLVEKLLESFRRRGWPEQGSKGRQARNAGSWYTSLMNLPLPSIQSIYRWTGKHTVPFESPLSILLCLSSKFGWLRFRPTKRPKRQSNGQRPASDFERSNDASSLSLSLSFSLRVNIFVRMSILSSSRFDAVRWID